MDAGWPGGLARGPCHRSRPGSCKGQREISGTGDITMKHKDMKAILLATRNSLSRIWALLRNEIESLLKDKQSLLIIFLLPLAVMLPFKFTNIGEAQREESEKVKKVPKKKMEGTAP